MNRHCVKGLIDSMHHSMDSENSPMQKIRALVDAITPTGARVLAISEQGAKQGGWLLYKKNRKVVATADQRRQIAKALDDLEGYGNGVPYAVFLRNEDRMNFYSVKGLRLYVEARQVPEKTYLTHVIEYDEAFPNVHTPPATAA